MVLRDRASLPRPTNPTVGSTVTTVFDSNVKGIDVNRRALSGVSGKYSRVAPNPSSRTYQRLTSNVKQEKGADGENLLNVVTCQKGEGPAVVGRQEGARDAAVSTSDRMNAT